MESGAVGIRCDVVQDSKSGHQLLRLPSNFCPFFASWTTQAELGAVSGLLQLVGLFVNPLVAAAGDLFVLHRAIALLSCLGASSRTATWTTSPVAIPIHAGVPKSSPG